MKTIAVDQYNDPVLGADGNLSIITGLAAIGQASVQFGRSRRSEMIHNMDSGVPFDLVAWAGAPNETQFEAVMRARLLQLPSVTAVTAFDVKHTGNVLSYTATLQTSAGDVTING